MKIIKYYLLRVLSLIPSLKYQQYLHLCRSWPTLETSFCGPLFTIFQKPFLQNHNLANTKNVIKITEIFISAYILISFTTYPVYIIVWTFDCQEANSKPYSIWKGLPKWKQLDSLIMWMHIRLGPISNYITTVGTTKTKAKSIQIKKKSI